MLSNCISVVCVIRALCWFLGLSVAISVFSDEDHVGGMNDANAKVASEKRDPFWPVGYIPDDAEARPNKIAPEKASQ